MTHKLQSALPLSLRALFPNGRFLGSADVYVTRCCTDARQCEPGDLYVALVTDSGDGHDNVTLAAHRGAAAVLAERQVLTTVPTLLVDDTREALGIVSHQLADNPSRSLFVAGVSGTSGKTATSHLLHSIWKQNDNTAGLMTNATFDDGQRQSASWHTPSGPMELAAALRQMVDNGCQRAVLELSSLALACRHNAGFPLDAAVFTRLRHDAANRHGSQQNYLRAKKRLLSSLHSDGVAIINLDDHRCRHLLGHIDRPTLTYGTVGEADVRATILERHRWEQTFLLHAGADNAVVHTRIVGASHVSHCLAAAAVSLVAGCSLTEIASGLSAVQDLPGHLQRVECGQPFGVFVDSTNHPDTLAMRLKELRQITAGRLICVFGPPRQAPALQRARLGAVVEKGADTGILTSNNRGHEPSLEIAHDVLDGYQHPARGHLIPDRMDAICWALDQARPGDAVLLAGKGHFTFQVDGDIIDEFDDQLVASEWLYRKGASPCYPDVSPTSLFVPHDAN